MDSLNLFLPELAQEYANDYPAAPAGAAQSGIPQIDTAQITPLTLGSKPAIAFVGGVGDATSMIVQGDASLYSDTYQGSPSAYFSWTDGSSLAAWIAQETKAGFQVTVVGHSYGADTAATAVANGSQVFNLVLLDPVSWFRPSLSALASNATNIYDYNAVGGSALQRSNMIAGIGGAWNHYAAGVAQMYDVVNANHAEIGSWDAVVSKILAH